MSKKILKKFATLAAALALTTGLAACGSQNKADDSGSKSSGVTEITVAASPTPHAKILEWLNSSGLAKKAGIHIKVIQYQSYNLPNQTLVDGDVDANYFQTVPFLEDQIKQFNYKLTAGKGIHLEPMGAYSKKIKDIKDLQDGATIGVVNNPTNQGRSLKLLSDGGLIKVDGANSNVVELNNTPGANPHNYKFVEVEDVALVKALDDVDLVVINGNIAQEAGYTPKDALVIESTKDNPSANILVWRTGDDNPAIQKLENLLHSQDVKEYIEKTWTDKSVLPVF